MARVKMQDIRRQELIEATVQTLYKKGFSELTVNEISKEAGISGGNVHYYFGGKNELLEATMRSFLNTLRHVCIARLAQANSPRERLNAVVLSNFDKAFFQLETVAAWTQFWAQAPYNKTLLRLQTINSARVHSNLLQALKQIVQPQHAQDATNMVKIIMDGIWLRCAQDPQCMSAEQAGALAIKGVDAVIGIYACEAT